jgi:hypothetical protein
LEKSALRKLSMVDDLLGLTRLERVASERS